VNVDPTVPRGTLPGMTITVGEEGPVVRGAGREDDEVERDRESAPVGALDEARAVAESSTKTDIANNNLLLDNRKVALDLANFFPAACAERFGTEYFL
jgi:hypothetical protein